MQNQIMNDRLMKREASLATSERMEIGRLSSHFKMIFQKGKSTLIHTCTRV